MDLWEFLNADPEELTAEVSDRRLAKDIRQIHGALRTLYELVATDSQDQKQLTRAELALRTWGKYASATYPSLTRQAPGQWGCYPTFEYSGLPSDVGMMISYANQKLYSLQPSAVFVCEYCGRIGPAKQKSKRFCNDNCRAAATYARHKGIKKAVT